MSFVPDHLLYTKDHEWLSKDSNECTIGITDHAQDSLGDVTFVEMPQAGTQFSKGEVFGVIESVKAASDLYMPVSGVISKVNDSLNDSPEMVNLHPYDDGWIVKIEPSNQDEFSDLLAHTDYEKEIGS